MKHSLKSLILMIIGASGPAAWVVIVATIGMNLLMLILPIYSLQIFDRVLTSRSVETLLYLTLIAVVLLSAYAFLEAIRLKLLVRIGNRYQLGLEAQVMDACIAQSARVSEPVQQPIKDLAIVRGFVSSPQGLVSLIDTPMALLFLIVVYLIHPMLGGAMLLGIALMIVIAILTEMATTGTVTRANNAGIQAGARATEIVEKAELIEAMGMRQSILDYWRHLNNESLHFSSASGDRIAVNTAIGRWTRLILSIALTGLGGYLAIQDKITIGGMIAASILMGRGLAPLETLIPLWRQLIGVRGSWQRMNEALVRFPRQENAMELPPPSGQLQVEKVVYVPQGTEAPTLKGISFQVTNGTILGVVGPVSAGKSTLAKLICGVWKPYSGTVRLDNADVYQWDRLDFGRHVGYMPQSADLFSGTVRDNIARFSSVATDKEVVAAAQITGVHDLILRLPMGYDTWVGTGGATLSGGFRQRICLARAIFGNPKLIVLDEPSSNLDATGEQALVQVLDTMRQRGATLVVITHHIPILKNADLIAVLLDGQLHRFGPRSEILVPAETASPLVAQA
jgi:PrtD family type I secretion system ABC transporter